MSDVAFFGDFRMGDRERHVLSGDLRLGDLLRGTTPSIAVSKSACFAGPRRLGERRRVVSSITEAMISYELRYQEIYYGTTLVSVRFSLVLVAEKRWVTELL
jgi:hypothetical protein